MTATFIRKGAELIKSAVEKDNNEEYEEAISEYSKGIQYLMTGLKYEKNQKVRNAIKEKVHKYLCRAEQIKESLPSTKKVKKKQKQTTYSYPSNEYINQTVKETKQKELDIVYGYFHDNEKLLNINYDIPHGIINLCLIYYHKPEKISIPSTYNSIIVETPSIKWEQVIGLTQAKQILKEKIILPIKFPSLFTGNDVTKSQFILLYGPPGCGKSYLAKAVGNEANKATFFQVSTSDLVSKYQIDATRSIKQLFDIAMERKPSIIVFDEIDSICGRCDYEYTVSRRIKTELLVQFHSIRSKGDANIYIIFCTNTPWIIKNDTAMNRRIDERIYVGLPSKDDREAMFESEMNMSGAEYNLSNEDYATLAEMTEGFSGADINGCIQDVHMEPVRELQIAKYFKRLYKDKNDTDADDYTLVPCDMNDDGAFQSTLTDFGDGDVERVRANPIEMTHFIKVLEEIISIRNGQPRDDDIAKHLQCMQDWNDDLR